MAQLCVGESLMGLKFFPVIGPANESIGIGTYGGLKTVVPTSGIDFLDKEANIAKPVILDVFP